MHWEKSIVYLQVQFAWYDTTITSHGTQIVHPKIPRQT